MTGIKALVLVIVALTVLLGALLVALTGVVVSEHHSAAMVEAAFVSGEDMATTLTLVAGTGLCDHGIDESRRGAADVLDAEQLANARIIIDTTASLGLPARAAVIAVATAMQESSLRNVNHGDRAGPDSRGLFQQRLRFYAAEGDPMDPHVATEMFLRRLVKVRNWQGRPLTVVAQAVQISAHPNAYARWEDLATDLVGRYQDANCT